MGIVFSLSALSPFAIGLFVTFAMKVVYNALNGRQLPYPPGPKPKFLIGNALDFPKAEEGRVFAEWGKQFHSDILHGEAFGMHVIVINSRKIAEDLLEKRADKYDDRPEIPIAKFMGWDKNLGLMKYGDGWRQHRKLCNQNLNADAAKHYSPIQIERVHNFLRNVLQEPEKVFDHSTLLSISTTMLMMYGYAPETLDDPVLHMAEEAAKLVGHLVALGGTLINVMPILGHIPSWVPGATAKRMAERARFLTEEAKRIPLEHVKTALREGTARPSLVSNFFEKKATVGASPEEETIVSNVAWTVFGGSSDSTASMIVSFLYIMVKHPDVQRRAQKEIDRVVGDSHLPDLNDRQDLPYIEAVYRELLRHTPPMRVGLPHAITEDDFYEGYFLPKGSTVITNIWAMNHEENVYPEPFSFKPERYLDGEGRLNDDGRILAYGFGRRICVGKSFASTTLWLVMVSFLTCFNIDKAKDESGNEMEVDDAYTDLGVVIHKKPFKCCITPRSEQIRKLIENTIEL